jgi:hypothetical protein
MASAVLSGASASANSPQIIAQSAQLGEGGLLTKGSIVCANGASITTTNDAFFGGLPNEEGAIFIQETPLAAVGAKQAFRFVVPATGALEGQLGLVGWDYTTDPPTQLEVLRINRPPREGAMILDFTSASQSGLAVVPAAATSVVVACPGLTATGVVLITCNTPAIAVQTKPPCVSCAANQFTITLQAVPGADATFSWFVAKSA